MNRSMKNTMMSLMRRIMLSCEEATQLASRKEEEALGMAKTMHLHLHLAVCKPCMRFYRQSALLSGVAKKQVDRALGRKVPLHRMSDEEKVKLQKLIHNRIQKI